MLKPLQDIYNNVQAGQLQVQHRPRSTGKNYEHYEKEFNDIFLRLKGIFPSMAHTIKTQQEYDVMRREWISAFVQGGLSINHVESGLTIAKQKNKDFIPSVGTFIAWCKEGTSTLLGLPTIDQVMREFKKYNVERLDYPNAESFPWTKPIMYWLVTDLRKNMMQYHQSDLEVSKRAEYLLDKWASRLSKGGTVPEIKIQIEDKTQPRTIASEIMGSDEKFIAMGQEFLKQIRSKKELSNG